MPSPNISWRKESFSRLAEKVPSHVRFETEQIDQLFEAYADLLRRAQESAPHLIEITALASVLQSFYNGLENIFLSIAKGIDEDVPTDSRRHRGLLIRLTEQMPARGRVISAEVAHKLADYLAFRHVYRHSYSFFFDWCELENLATPVQEVRAQVKKELQLFPETLNCG